MITKAVGNIFRINLGVKRHERVLVFTDRPSPLEVLGDHERARRSRLPCIAFLVAEVGKGYAGEVLLHECEATGSHGAEPAVGLWELAFGKKAVSELRRRNLLDALLQKRCSPDEMAKAEAVVGKRGDDAVAAVIALANYSTSHTSFRDLLTRVCGSRYASMPLFDFSMLEGPMNVDWKKLASFSKKVASVVSRADMIEMKTPNGTRLSFSARGRKAVADTGILTGRGAFGNLPAGEVYLAPVEGTAAGRLVLEWAPSRPLKSAVTVLVEDGEVREVVGAEDHAAQLRERLSEREENRNIAEFGIGTNGRANRPDNVLESEKILGTVHVALGDNSSFGGKVMTPFHEDYVFFRPTITLHLRGGEKRLLMKDGRFEGEYHG